MNDDFDKDRVLARVKKMMALANDAGATEGERDNALRMAHATLAKYNLSMAEADAAGLAPVEARMNGTFDMRGIKPWMRTAAAAVANLYFCKFFFSNLQNGSLRYNFVGKESNVYTAKEMSKYVIDSIWKEGRAAAKAVGETATGTYWRSFCKGAAGRVYQRCEEIRRTAEAVPSTGTSLVLASVYQKELLANAEFIAQQLGLHLKSGVNRERNTQYSGYQAGRAYGDRIGLSTQVGARESKRIK